MVWLCLGLCHACWRLLVPRCCRLGTAQRSSSMIAAVTHALPYLQGLNNLAVIYTQQGRAQEALHLLQAAIMAAPGYAEAHNNLGVLQASGRGIVGSGA